MQKSTKWIIGGLVVMATFAVVTWLCGAVLLPHDLKDPGIRWGVAAAAGAVLAGFLALWGQSFAADEQHKESDDGAGKEKAAGQAGGSVTGPGDVKAVFKGGIFHQPVTVARDIRDPGAIGSAPPSREQAG